MFEADRYNEDWIQHKYVFLANLKLLNENHSIRHRENRQQSSTIVDGRLQQEIGILYFL